MALFKKVKKTLSKEEWINSISQFLLVKAPRWGFMLLKDRDKTSPFDALLFCKFENTIKKTINPNTINPVEIEKQCTYQKVISLKFIYNSDDVESQLNVFCKHVNVKSEQAILCAINEIEKDHA